MNSFYTNPQAIELMKNGFWLILQMRQKLREKCYNIKDIEQTFGSWNEYIKYVSPEFPKIQANKNFIELQSLIDRSNAELDKAIEPISDNDIKKWILHKLIPRSRKSGKVGFFSETLIPLLVKIKILVFLGFGPKQIYQLMSICGKYNNLMRVKCQSCNITLNGYMQNNVAICFGCAK